jgi:hypothetical protein
VLLNGSAVDLLGRGGYECYMRLLWERRVHAPVRGDMFFFERPGVLLFLIVGGLGLLPRFHKSKWRTEDLCPCPTKLMAARGLAPTEPGRSLPSINIGWRGEEESECDDNR